MAYQELKTAIASVIKENGRHEITGNLLQDCLMAIINTFGEGYQFMGVATPETEPITGDGKYFYLAGKAGTYSQFGVDISLQEGQLVVLTYDSTEDEWKKHIIAEYPVPLFVEINERFGEKGGGGDYPSLVGIGKTFNEVKEAFLSGRPVFFYRPQKYHANYNEEAQYYRVTAYRQMVDTDPGEIYDFGMALFIDSPGFMGFDANDEAMFVYCNRWMDEAYIP